MSAATTQLAIEYCNRGWHPIPIPTGSKNPGRKGWINLRLTEADVPALFDAAHQNIGVLLGLPGNGVYDVDLDSPEARALASSFLPPTGLMFGRPSSPCSHWLYVCAGDFGIKRFEDPLAGDTHKAMLVELRGTGGQTVVPPSIHPSGEQIAWVRFEQPGTPAWDDLESRCRLLAAAALLARYWKPGCRHNAALALAGALLHCRRIPPDEVPDFVYRVCAAAGDDELEDRLTAAQTTLTAFREGKHTTGWPVLAPLLSGDGVAIVAAVRRWLLVDEEPPPSPPGAQAVTSGAAPPAVAPAPASPQPAAKPTKPVKKALSIVDMARKFLKQYYWSESADRPIIVSYREDFYLYRGTHYDKIAQGDLESKVQTWLHRIGEPATPHQTRDLVYTLSRYSRIPAHKETPCWLLNGLPEDPDQYPEPTNIIPCKNGLLDLSGLLDDERPTAEPRLLPHSPAWFSVSSLSLSYDPQAQCPTWLEFLDQVLPDDPDSQAVLQNWFGLCLTPDMSHEKILLLVGPPRSGKSTITRILGDLVGKSNRCSPQLSTLGDTFGLAPLLNKTLAIIPDATIGRHADANRILESLKAISGRDGVAVNRKFREQLDDAVLNVRFVLTVNSLPQFYDDSGALHERLLIVPFEVSFVGQEDRGLYAKLRQELPGILRWSIAGLVSLRQSASFSQSQSARDLLAEYRNLSSPVASFIEGCCEVHPDHSTPVDALYQAFIAWAKTNGHSPMAAAAFGSKLRAVNPRIRKGRIGSRSEREYRYLGISLRAVTPAWYAQPEILPL